MPQGQHTKLSDTSPEKRGDWAGKEKAGLDPSKIKTELGNPQGGMNANYSITTTEIKKQ